MPAGMQRCVPIRHTSNLQDDALGRKEPVVQAGDTARREDLTKHSMGPIFCLVVLAYCECYTGCQWLLVSFPSQDAPVAQQTEPVVQVCEAVQRLSILACGPASLLAPA